MVGASLLDKAARLAAVCPTTKTARARSEAFRDSSKQCSYQRAKHVTTSRDAVFLYASPQLLDAAFHYAPSDDYTSDAPPRRRVLLRAAAYSRPTFVNTRQLCAAVQPRVWRSSTPSSPCNSVHGSINAESLVAQPRARQNNPDPKHSTFQNNQFLEQSIGNNKLLHSCTGEQLHRTINR